MALGNIISGLLSVVQGDDPDEILKKQFITTMMGGQVPAGVDSASTVAPHLAQTGAEQAVASGIGGELATGMVTQNPALTNGMGQSSNMLTQLGRDAGASYGEVTDKLSGYGTELNDFTGMENKDWTKLGIQGGVSALSAPPPKRPQPAPMGQGISKPMGQTPSNQASLLSSNPAMSQAGGQQLTPEEIMKLKQQGIL